MIKVYKPVVFSTDALQCPAYMLAHVMIECKGVKYTFYLYNSSAPSSSRIPSPPTGTR